MSHQQNLIYSDLSTGSISCSNSFQDPEHLPFIMARNPPCNLVSSYVAGGKKQNPVTHDFQAGKKSISVSLYFDSQEFDYSVSCHFATPASTSGIHNVTDQVCPKICRAKRLNGARIHSIKFLISHLSGYGTEFNFSRIQV